MEEIEFKAITDRISKTLKEEIDKCYTFHNYEHTLAVVRAAFIMSFYHKLNKYDHKVLMLSAWFHDLGYILDAEQHERISSIYAEDYLTNYDCPDYFINDIQETIISTKLSHKPKNIVQMILKDADLFHLSQPYFLKVTEKLKCEVENICGKEISERDWITSNINFFESHQYYSGYGKKFLVQGKKTNLDLLKKTTSLLEVI